MIKLYNTLSRKKEEFKPIKDKEVGIYSCGPTVYNYAHIGNLSSYLRWDFLRRIFEYNGYKVNQVMNITDVDDKTIRNSQKQHKSLKEFTEFYTEKFFADLKKLNIEPAEKYPKATDHIKEMIELVQKLLDKGFAYKTDDGIYFSIAKFKNYGKLSHLDLEKLKTGASGRVKSDEYDKDTANDFVLWKFWDENDGDVFWQAPFGKGRPGWHLECSAMSEKYLTCSEQCRTIDIHTGGVDLIFPHHENEIAQSEAATDKNFVNYWVHNEHLLVDGKKMSKSLGNFYVLKDILNKKINPLAFRYLLLTSHYRKKINFTWESLEAAQSALEKLYKEVKNCHSEHSEESQDSIIQEYKDKFIQVLNDDMGTPEAIAILWEVIKSDNKKADIYATVIDFDKVLGLELANIKEEKVPENIFKKAKQMDSARNNKDFATADKLRKEILDAGYKVENTTNGSEITM